MQKRAIALAWMLAACGSGKAAPATEGCDLSGLYRLRFDAGVGQWMWFRFRIAPNGQAAQLEKPTAFAPGKDGYTLKLDPDPGACKATVTATSERGDLLGSITLDPKTHKVTGTLRVSGAREGVTLEGMRDQGPIPSGPNACIEPGMYKLVVPSEQAWDSTDAGADCSAAKLEVPFLVEPFGDKLLVDQIDPDGTASWAAEDTSIDGPCAVSIRFRHRERTVQAQLTFSGDQVTAQGHFASVQHVTTNGDSWKCSVMEPMIWVEREKT